MRDEIKEAGEAEFNDDSSITVISADPEHIENLFTSGKGNLFEIYQTFRDTKVKNAKHAKDHKKYIDQK